MKNMRLVAIVLLLTAIVVSPICFRVKTTGASTLSGRSKIGTIRAWHFVLLGVSQERARWMVDLAHKAGFNLVTVGLTQGVRLQKAPWTPRKDAWTRDELKAWAAYAKEQGMEVVPEIKLLTHQEWFFQNSNSELMFNKVTYDPRQEEVYKVVFPLLEEVITLMRPHAVHIGHDEVARHVGNWIRPGEQVLPADLFLEDVLRIHVFLKNRGIETWMWGDMLLSFDEFPGMLDRHLHGVMSGYGKALRAKVPHDVVICDWHYFDDQPDFPSLVTMQKEGFRVIGSTWKKESTTRNFSRYAEKHGAYGMMATTWLKVGEWDAVEKIINVSGEIFRASR